VRRTYFGRGNVFHATPGLVLRGIKVDDQSLVRRLPFLQLTEGRASQSSTNYENVVHGEKVRFEYIQALLMVLLIALLTIMNQ